MKLFIEDMQGYNEIRTGVKNIRIQKVDGKNTLVINYWLSTKETEYIFLNEIREVFMVDMKTKTELFRYVK